MEAHHVKIGAVHDAGANFPGIAEADHCKTDGRELAEGAECFDARAQILNFWHREWDFPGGDARRALLDVDELLLVAIDERPKEHAAHQAENGGSGATTERQREHQDGCQSFSARQGSYSKPQVFHKG